MILWERLQPRIYPGHQRFSQFRLVGECRELVGLVLADQRPDDRAEVPFEDFREFVQGEIDAVVGDPALRIVIGADALGPVAAADQRFSLLRLFRFALCNLGVQEFCLQQ